MKETTHAKTKPKLLLVEHDDFLCRAVQSSFEDAHYEVSVARNGVEAVTKLRFEKPDIVLLDLLMPIKNGFDILEEVKLDEELKKIPVIVFSNLTQDSDIQKAKELGAVEYLVKNELSMKEVVDKVREYMTKSKVNKGA